MKTSAGIALVVGLMANTADAGPCNYQFSNGLCRVPPEQIAGKQPIGGPIRMRLLTPRSEQVSVPYHGFSLHCLVDEMYKGEPRIRDYVLLKHDGRSMMNVDFSKEQFSELYTKGDGAQLKQLCQEYAKEVYKW